MSRAADLILFATLRVGMIMKPRRHHLISFRQLTECDLADSKSPEEELSLKSRSGERIDA
jgi:hypothetical protein